jgi:protein-S-isoprenylcysteine O-methyltransferase Ste14
MTSWAQVARRIRVPVGFAFAAFYFWTAKPVIVSLVVGAFVAAAGLLIRAVASGHVTKNEALTTSGPYAHVRNPLYLGSLITAAGFAIAARSLCIVAAMAIIFFLIYLPVIRSEETFLRATFPEFHDYADHVHRLIPRVTPYGNSAGSFSWHLYRKHREYNAIIGAAFMLGALVVKMMWFRK